MTVDVDCRCHIPTFPVYDGAAYFVLQKLSWLTSVSEEKMDHPEGVEGLRPASDAELLKPAVSTESIVAKSENGSPVKSISSNTAAVAEEEDEKVESIAESFDGGIYVNDQVFLYNLTQPIDDDEFNIPALDFEPTLESILNDVEDGSWSDDEGQGVALEPIQLIQNLVS